MMHFKGIGKLIEEMGEVQQLLGKAIAFPTRDHPDGKGNIHGRLPDELADLRAAITYFEEENSIYVDTKRYMDKLVQFQKWGLSGVVDETVSGGVSYAGVKINK